MIVDIIHLEDVSILEPEHDPPIPTNVYGVMAGEFTRKSVEAQPGQIHVTRLSRGVQAGQNQPQALRVFRSDSSRCPFCEELAEPLVPKCSDHRVTPSEAPIQQAVLDSLTQVVFVDLFHSLDVGDGAGDAADLVECAGGEAQFVHRLLHQEQAGFG